MVDSSFCASTTYILVFTVLGSTRQTTTIYVCMYVQVFEAYKFTNAILHLRIACVSVNFSRVLYHMIVAKALRATPSDIPSRSSVVLHMHSHEILPTKSYPINTAQSTTITMHNM